MTSHAQMFNNRRGAKSFRCQSVVLHLTLVVLMIVTVSDAANFDYIPPHHQTSYYTLLRKMRAGIAASNPGRTATNFPSSAAGSISGETCAKVVELCSKTCKGVDCSLTKKIQVEGKLRCVEKCFNTDTFPRSTRAKDLIQSSPSTNQLAKDVLAATESSDEEKGNDVLTAAEKCRGSGNDDSEECLFAYSKDISHEVVQNALKKLMADERADKKQETNDFSNKLRHSSVTSPSSLLRRASSFKKKRSIHLVNRIRTPTTVAPSNIPKVEVCPTRLKIIQPSTAVHWKSGRPVYLYHGQNNTDLYVQKFEVGICSPLAPVVRVRVPGREDPVCRPLLTKHLANFFVEQSRLATTPFQGIRCQTINASISICRDWIYLSSQCKLYL